MASLLLSPDTLASFQILRRHLQTAQRDDPFALAWLIMPARLEQAWRLHAGASLNVHTLALHAAGSQTVGSVMLERAGQPALVLDRFQRRLLVRELLAQAHRRKELQVLPGAAEKPGLIRHLDDLLQEMKRQAVSPVAFQTYADDADDVREQDIALLFRRYEETLRREGVTDETGAMAAACDLLDAGAATADLPVYAGVMGYVRFAPLQIRFLRRMLPRVPDACVFLPAAADSVAPGWIQEVAAELELSPSRAADTSAAAARSRVVQVEAPTPEHEVRYVLRAAKRLRLEGKAEYRDMALCVPDAATYAALLQEVATEYGVPLALPQTVAQSPLWVFLRQLLHLYPDFDWHACWDVFASPFLRQSLLSAEEMAAVRFMTARCRVIQGRAQWRAALDPTVTWSAEEQARMSLADDRRQALLPKVERLFDALSPPADDSALDGAAWVERLLRARKEDPVGLVLPPSLEDGENLDSFRAQTALALMRQVAADARFSLVSRAALPWEEVRELLLDDMAVREILVHKPDSAAPVTAFAQGWMLPTRHLFVLGMNEDALPPAPDRSVFYAPPERADHPLPLERHDSRLAGIQWDQLRANCRTQATLCRPALAASAPSPFWDADADAIRIGRDELPAFDAAASRTELLLALLHQRARAVPSALEDAYAKANRLAGLTAARLSAEAPGPFEGALKAPDVVCAVRQRFGADYVWSPSSLQDYARCPMGFFVSRVLRLEPEVSAEAGLDLKDRGALAHALLHRLYQRLIDEKIELAAAQEKRILSAAVRIGHDLWRSAPAQLRFQPYPLADFDRREIENLVQWCVRNEMRAAAGPSSWTPLRLEWRFASVLDTGNAPDASFALRGIVDRVDRNDRGALRVIDYKTRRRAYAATDTDFALANQTVLYAWAVSQQNWGPVAESGYRLLGRTEDAKLQNAVRFQDGAVAAHEKVTAMLARIRDQQADVRAGFFPNAPPRLEGQNDRCAEWCPLSDFCQPSPATRRKGRPRGI